MPDSGAVAAARARRQALWDMVARTAFGGAAPDAAGLAALGGVPLPLAYERAVAEADLLADRRADESGLVERAVLAEQSVAEAVQAEAAARQRALASETAAAAAEAAWRRLLPAPLPQSCRLDDLRVFTGARLRTLERWEAAELAREAAAALAARQAAWAARLHAAMPGSDPASLPQALAAARRHLEKTVEAEKRAATLAASIRQLEEQHRAAEMACRQSDADRLAWQQDWAHALASLGRPTDEAPDTTEDILGVLADLDWDLTQAAGMAQRIAGIRSDNAAFAAAVGAASAASGREPASASDAQAALIALRALRTAAVEASHREARRTTLRQQRDQATRQIVELTAAVAQREAEAAAVLAAIGADTPEEAENRLSQAADRTRHELALDKALESLRRDGDGIAVDALREAAARASAEDVTRALYTAEAEAEAARTAAEDLAARVALLRRSLAEREAATSYADAMAAQNEAAAAAGRALRDAAVARLAASLLQNAMDAVEKEGSPAMLTGIGTWFSQLTGGAYPGIGVEQTAEGAALTLTQAGYPHEPKGVKELSEGTRDQLFLALRLAAIETHPMALPFIADDILQTSDDVRAAAALRALVALTAHTQVILLTHHRHLLALAEALPESAVHVCDFGQGVRQVEGVLF